ncbi:MAG: hypothetical protein ACK5MA_09795 [Parachlamydiaceae bacterium]
MRQMIYWFLAVLLHVGALTGNDWKVEVRSAYFSPTMKELRNAYGSGWGEVHVQGCYRVCGPWEAWLDVGYGKRVGKHDLLIHAPKIRLYPIALGIRYLFPICPGFQVFASTGVVYGLLREILKGENYNHYHSKNAFGGMLELGGRYLFYDCFYLELFSSFRYLKFSAVHSSSAAVRHGVNFSGFLSGAGLGYTF